jgi:hypothetical protein
VKIKATIEFASIGEAARWLACYTGECTDAIKNLRAEIGYDDRSGLGHNATGVDTTAVAQAAVAKLAEYFGTEIGETPPEWLRQREAKASALEERNARLRNGAPQCTNGIGTATRCALIAGHTADRHDNGGGVSWPLDSDERRAVEEQQAKDAWQVQQAAIAERDEGEEEISSRAAVKRCWCGRLSHAKCLDCGNELCFMHAEPYHVACPNKKENRS